VEFYDAMIAAGASAEMHLFRHGAHGSGLGMGNAGLGLWTVLLEGWLRDQKLACIASSKRFENEHALTPVSVSQQGTATMSKARVRAM
jgi:hypothetical protein